LSPTPDVDAGMPVGVVTRLYRYPVKSMAAESLASAELAWTGLAGDRKWAFVRPGSSTNGMPWHTIRDNPAMWLYRPRLLDAERPDKSLVEVQAPDGSVYDLTDPVLADRLGENLRLMRLDRGTFDALPVSLITTTTVAELCVRAGAPVTELRFRPNVVITPASGLPYAEDDWVGRQLSIGQAIVRVDRRDNRCVVMNVDPQSGQPDAPLLQTAGRHHHAQAGVYGSTVSPGLIRLGDPVLLGPAGWNCAQPLAAS
jgi:MOSC domain-containing protein